MLCLIIVPTHINEYIIIMFTIIVRVYARCFSIILTNLYLLHTFLRFLCIFVVCNNKTNT